MERIGINTADVALYAAKLSAGDTVLLSGTVYTSRDAAHKRIAEALRSGAETPFPLPGAFVYYMGPTPGGEARPVGSAGPTTSGRMDVYTPLLLENGLSAMIGKGPRSDEVVSSIVSHGALYFAAVGGAGALYSKSVISCEVIAYEDLGCESVKKLTVCDMPLYVAIDSRGNSIFKGTEKKA